MPALAVIEIGGGGGPVALQIVNLRQIDGVDQREPGQRASNHRQQQQRGQREFAGQLAPVRRWLRFKPVASSKAARLIRLDGCLSQAVKTSRTLLPFAWKRSLKPKASTGALLKSALSASCVPDSARGGNAIREREMNDPSKRVSLMGSFQDGMQPV